MRRFITKKRMLVTGGIAALAVAGIAVAYWTSAGTGTGTGTASTTGTITLAGTVAPGLVPGGSEAVSFTASNSGTAPVKLGTVHLVGVAVDAGHSGCSTADFTMPDVLQGESIPGGASNKALANSGTLSFANTAVNQDACKGATLTLSLSST